MITADTLKRVMLDALAAGQDYDGFRTALRQKLKDAADEQSPDDASFLETCRRYATSIGSRREALLAEHARNPELGLIWMLPGFPQASDAGRRKGREIILAALRSAPEAV